MILLNQSIIDNLTDINLTLLLKTIARNNTPLFDDEYVLYPIEWVIPITVLYGIIFITGIIGNVSTCIVISRSKSLHTVTNYYLFSIAMSDLLLLISGLPPEMYRIWSPEKYVFGEAFCVVQGFAAETSANATVLAITAFTVERYLAICHPFRSHTMSNLSRAIKYIIAIWIVALCLAAPQAIQFGVSYETKHGVEYSKCTVVSTDLFQHAFEISTFLIFVGPMTLITVLYVLIGIKLRKSRRLYSVKKSKNDGVSRASRIAASQKRVIKMLIAVVVAFFICWAPFHAQRLLAVYLSAASADAQAMSISTYIALMYISGVLYFLSTTVNPVLYHIMSNKFREAFKNTYHGLCGKDTSHEVHSRTYSVLSRCPPSLRNYQRSVSDGVHTQQSPANQGDIEAKEYVPQQSASRQNSSNFRTRTYSESSQTTVLTMFSKSITGSTKVKLDRKTPRLIRTATVENKKVVENKTYLGGFNKLFSFFRRPHRLEEGIALRNCNSDANNAISNSSLQDLEEMEFTNSDLVRYMEEVNEDLT